MVDAIGLDGSHKELTRVTLPAHDVSLADLPRSDGGALGVRALDATGKTLLRGESLYVQWGALEDRTLEVFVQRAGELARPPRGPLRSTPPSSRSRRAVSCSPRTGPPPSCTTCSTCAFSMRRRRCLARPDRSPRCRQTTALVIDEQGATAFDLETRASDDMLPPAGATFAEIADGVTIEANDGAQYVAAGDARVLDLACAADCKPAAWPGALGFARADAFALGPEAALVVGDDATGATRAVRVSATEAHDVPLRTPRRGARPVALPQPGFSMIVGGGAPGLEQYVE